MINIEKLAELIRKKNDIDNEIAIYLGKPTTTGYIGEIIASEIFDIQLEESGRNQGFDGRFTQGDLEGKTVNIKFYPRRENVLDMNKNKKPDYYLVLTGEPRTAITSKDTIRPLVIKSVYLFNAQKLEEQQRDRHVETGSIIEKLWTEAEIYPNPTNGTLKVSKEQIRQLELFPSTKQNSNV